MLYVALKDSGLDDYKVLWMAHSMLNTDEGLNEDQYDMLREFVYDMIGPTAEMIDLFEHVDATDGRFYITEAQTRTTNYETISSCD